MAKHNLRIHEVIGLFLLFVSGTCFGIGLYITVWAAMNQNNFLLSKDFLMFPLFFGTSFMLWALGNIELKEAMPGKRKVVVISGKPEVDGRTQDP